MRQIKGVFFSLSNCMPIRLRMTVMFKLVLLLKEVLKGNIYQYVCNLWFLVYH